MDSDFTCATIRDHSCGFVFVATDIYLMTLSHEGPSKEQMIERHVELHIDENSHRDEKDEINITIPLLITGNSEEEYKHNEHMWITAYLNRFGFYFKRMKNYDEYDVYMKMPGDESRFLGYITDGTDIDPLNAEDLRATYHIVVGNFSDYSEDEVENVLSKLPDLSPMAEETEGGKRERREIKKRSSQNRVWYNNGSYTIRHLVGGMNGGQTRSPMHRTLSRSPTKSRSPRKSRSPKRSPSKSRPSEWLGRSSRLNRWRQAHRTVSPPKKYSYPRLPSLKQRGIRYLIQ